MGVFPALPVASLSDMYPLPPHPGLRPPLPGKSLFKEHTKPAPGKSAVRPMTSGGQIGLFSGLVIALWRILLPSWHSPKGLREDVTGRDKAALLPQFLANLMNCASLRKSSPANKYKSSERQDSRHPLTDHPQRAIFGS
jgi:hypothetical protein